MKPGIDLEGCKTYKEYREEFVLQFNKELTENGVEFDSKLYDLIITVYDAGFRDCKDMIDEAMKKKKIIIFAKEKGTGEYKPIVYRP